MKQEDWGCLEVLEQGLDYSLSRVSIMPGQTVELSSSTGKTTLVGLDGNLTLSPIKGPWHSEQVSTQRIVTLAPNTYYKGKVVGDIPAEFLLIKWR